MAERAEIVLSARDTTASAFQSVEKRLGTLKAGLAGFTGGAAFGAIAAGADLVSKAFEKIDPRTVIDAADQLGKLSQRSGIAVEQLSALSFAAKLADVSQEELSSGLKRLNVNIAAAARGEKEQAAAFRTLGLAVKDSSGNVRNAADVLGDLADRFQSYKDGPNKVALANAVGGKSFEKLIPLLNDGRAGIEKARLELEKYGGVFTGEFADKSQRFNDNMTRLSVAAEKLKITVAGGLIDRLLAMSEAMVEGAKNGHLLAAALEHAARFMLPDFAADFIFAKALPADKLKQARDDVATLTPLVEKLQAQLNSGSGGKDVSDRIERLKNRVQSARKVLDAESDRIAKISAELETAFNTGKIPGVSDAPPKPDAPGLPDPNAAANAEALLRKQLEGRTKAIQDSLEKERDLFQFSESRLSELYQHGDLSIQQYFDAKSAAADAFLQKQQKALADQIAAQRDFETKATKPQDKADAENKIAELLNQQAKAYREAGQAAEVAETQRTRASEEFQKSLTELQAQLDELSGDEFGAELKRNALRLDEARKALGKGGGDKGLEESLARRLTQQAEANELQRQYARLTEGSQVAEEAFLEEANRGGLSRVDAEKGVLRIREQAIAQLDELISKQEELVAAGGTEEQILQLQRLRLARDKAFDVKDPALNRFREVIDGGAQSLASGLEDAIVDGKKLSDVFKAAEKDFVRLVTRDFVTTPLATSLSNFFKDALGTGGKTAGGAGGSDLFGSIFSFIGGLFHTGGIAGAAATMRGVSPFAFAAAERYHSGGIAGLAADEVPAILRRGEEVLTKGDPRHRSNGGTERTVHVTNNFVLQQPASKETQSTIALKVGQATQRALARDG